MSPASGNPRSVPLGSKTPERDCLPRGPAPCSPYKASTKCSDYEILQVLKNYHEKHACTHHPDLADANISPYAPDLSRRKSSFRDSSRGPAPAGPAPCWPRPLSEDPPSWNRGFALPAGLRISASHVCPSAPNSAAPGGLGVDTDGTTGRVAGPPVPGDSCAAVPPPSAGDLLEGPAAPARPAGRHPSGRPVENNSSAGVAKSPLQVCAPTEHT